MILLIYLYIYMCLYIFWARLSCVVSNNWIMYMYKQWQIIHETPPGANSHVMTRVFKRPTCAKWREGLDAASNLRRCKLAVPMDPPLTCSVWGVVLAGFYTSGSPPWWVPALQSPDLEARPTAWDRATAGPRTLAWARRRPCQWPQPTSERTRKGKRGADPQTWIT